MSKCFHIAALEFDFGCRGVQSSFGFLHRSFGELLECQNDRVGIMSRSDLDYCIQRVSVTTIVDCLVSYSDLALRGSFEREVHSKRQVSHRPPSYETANLSLGRVTLLDACNLRRIAHKKHPLGLGRRDRRAACPAEL